MDLISHFKKAGFTTVFWAVAISAMAWGKTGHRIVGQIAEDHLTPKAKQAVLHVLNNESLAMCSNWMDFIKADHSYNYMYDWHYCTIPDGGIYQPPQNPHDGLLLEKLPEIIAALKSHKLSPDSEAIDLKCLVHLVGDIHQPLHVGNGTDRGGNDVRVTWFKQPTNLHAVWDSKIINEQELSYTEYASYLETSITPEMISKWQSTGYMEWAKESVSYRKEVYDLPSNNELSYGYIFKNLHILELRLQQAGIRLAGILNEIYS